MLREELYLCTFGQLTLNERLLSKVQDVSTHGLSDGKLCGRLRLARKTSESFIRKSRNKTNSLASLLSSKLTM